MNSESDQEMRLPRLALKRSAVCASPIRWVLSLPFRLVGITFSALFAFLHALLMLPARLLGWTPRPGERAMA